ncbi:unnamed protein product [Medioppia subpectinata]|uniref:Uncharacterized protein n=1 Tax=Medioppia subpectinata TaxID=1979941 RepID=A0A7R9Q6M1_9ACAR|nr:unnamed protein product [Medioppia subpectinata]CAG2114585.1 unnamed protein product [Medioppia subpectinata]
MASRKNNGNKHHPRKHPPSDQNNRRRLSKQEEIDLTVEGIDLKDETINGSDKSNNWTNNSETSVAPTIHVNAVEDKCDHKLSIEKGSNDLSEGLDENNVKTMQKMDSDSGQSLNGIQRDTLLTEDNREKKRGKHLARAEAVRDTSASPPPTQDSDGEDKSSHMLAVVSSNFQSQIGSSMGSQNSKHKIKSQENSLGSVDRSSPCLSRDSSVENSSDLTGTDVQQFLIDTIQKNKKDRVFLLKIEQELNVLVKDTKSTGYKFPAMTSYNRMLVHRVAALFGFEHNVDILGTAVVVNKCKTTRIPDLKFKDYIKEDLLHEPKKSILKRDSASLEDGSNGSNVSFDGKEKSPDRQTGSVCDGTRNKSFEEREERYEKARARIFNQESSSSNEGNDTNNHVMTDTIDSNHCEEKTSSPLSSQSADELPNKPNSLMNNEVRAWSSTESDSSGRLPKVEAKQSVQPNAKPLDLDTNSKPNAVNVSGKASLLAPEGQTYDRSKSANHLKNRPQVSKASSFGGISHNIDNSLNTNSTHLSKSGSFNATPIANQPINASNNINTNRSNTPKNKTEYVHKQHLNNTYTGGGNQHSDQRYQSSHHSNPSHHNRHHNWHQNSHPRNNNRMAPNVQWPQHMNQNYPQFVLQHQQNDLNTNQMKEPHYLHSGQQVPSNMGNVWIIGNGLYPQSTSPMIACPPPANTPPSGSIGSNIAPFVGMSYQHYRPQMNSNAAQSRAPPLLKNHPIMTPQANPHRIVSSNGNQYVQQSVPEMLDIMGANNYVNRGPVVPQVNQMRRMPVNMNQGLDVRLVGQQSSPPFLLPTPQRQYFPVVPNAMPVSQRHSHESNSNNVNQRLKSSYNKNKPNRYTNNRNILVGNTNAHHFSNT